MNKYNCKVIRSKRKTVGLEIGSDGLILRAPQNITDDQIDEVIIRHQRWIDKQLLKREQQKKELAVHPPLTIDEKQKLADRALLYIPERVKHFAPLVGVKYNKITIRNQKTRWGSCSSKGNLNFNCLLMLTPPDVIDSVVVHELCHLKQMNHSDKFYAEILRVFPDYKRCAKWLKENGKILMMRNR